MVVQGVPGAEPAMHCCLVIIIVRVPTDEGVPYPARSVGGVLISLSRP